MQKIQSLLWSVRGQSRSHFSDHSFLKILKDYIYLKRSSKIYLSNQYLAIYEVNFEVNNLKLILGTAELDNTTIWEQKYNTGNPTFLENESGRKDDAKIQFDLIFL